MENHHPDRKEFQIDCLILFTDAVFAIAITLLIIEIKVPEIHNNITESHFWQEMQDLTPKFLGFMLSFFIIGIYWFVHHGIFGYVINYTSKLIWLNIIFLFSIVTMPFSSAVYSDYSTSEEYIKLIGPFAVYAANICFTGLMNFALLNYIFNPKNKVADHIPPRKIVQLQKARALTIPAIFIIAVLFSYISPEYGRLFLFAIPFAMGFIGRKMKKLRAKEV